MTKPPSLDATALTGINFTPIRCSRWCHQPLSGSVRFRRIRGGVVLVRSVIRLASVFLLAWGAFAQSDRGTITGTISDPAGAVVANAAVEVTNTATGVQYQAATTATGNYTVPQLPAGVYTLSIAVPGFKKFTRQGITVEVAATIRIDIALEVGAATESVTVQAD